jgi:hypothetical protein
MVDVNNFPLSECVIKEFTLECGYHFRLALCEHTVMGGRKVLNVIYVTDDKKTYVREIHGGRWVTNDNTQIGEAISDGFFFMEAERMKFIKWL